MELLLCNAEESAALLAALAGAAASAASSSSAAAAAGRAGHALPALPEAIWDIILAMFCENARAEADRLWLQARLRRLHAGSQGGYAGGCVVARPRLAAAGGDHVAVVEESGRKGGEDAGEDEDRAAAPRIPSRDAIALSMVNRRFHHVIGKYSALPCNPSALGT